MTEQTAPQSQNPYKNDVSLTLISDAKVREGTTKEGKPYAMLEVNAFKRNFEKNQETGQWDKMKPTYYNVAYFGDKEAINDLASKLKNNVEIKASGFEKDYTYQDKNGNERTVKQFQPKVLSLDINQTRMMSEKVEFDKNSVPKEFQAMQKAYDKGKSEPGTQTGEPAYRSALQLRVLDVQVKDLPKGQQETGKRDVKVVACNPETKDVYHFEGQKTSKEAYAIKGKVEQGMQVRISGEVTPMGDKVYKGELKSIGIDMQQKGLKVEFTAKDFSKQTEKAAQQPQYGKAQQEPQYGQMKKPDFER